MQKIYMMFRSRTVWTIIAMFAIGGLNAVDAYVPTTAKPFIEALLGIAAIYFRVNPRI